MTSPSATSASVRWRTRCHDIKTAGSLSLAVSLPTMLVAFARYSRDGSFTVLRSHARLAGVLAAGSIVGTVLGGLLLGVVPEAILVPGLAARTERLELSRLRRRWNQSHDQAKMAAQLDIRRQMFSFVRRRVETPAGSTEPSELATR